MPSPFDFTDRRVLVTGGSRGLGRAMALGFARAGADVAIASRKLDACERVAAEIRAMGRLARAVACNVSRWQELDALVEAVYSPDLGLGGLDVLVNNAGMSPLYDSLESVTEELFDKVIAVNLKGPFRLSALVGRRMVESGGGVILNVSSIAAVQPAPDAAPYGAAKAGLESLTRSLAFALGPTVRVNCIEAGPFFTDVSRHWNLEAFADRAEHDIALRRGGEPEEIVGAALYLASEGASFTTGAVLRVDGGSR
ncbi:MAG TPA: SDR family oxidoreductase [Thermoanaerobaculia bacterium]|nr:SDR family oxidoreductase [Thermoanaerobaculia bacterium]